MSLITSAKINSSMDFSNISEYTDLVYNPLLGEDHIEISIKDLNKFNRKSYNEFHKYYTRLFDIYYMSIIMIHMKTGKNINNILPIPFFEFIADITETSVDYLEGLYKLDHLFPYIFFNLVIIYIKNNKKKIKKRIKKGYIQHRIWLDIYSIYKGEDTGDILNHLNKYKRFKEENPYKGLKEYEKMVNDTVGDKTIFNKLFKIYTNIIECFPNNSAFEKTKIYKNYLSRT